MAVTRRRNYRRRLRSAGGSGGGAGLAAPLAGVNRAVGSSTLHSVTVAYEEERESLGNVERESLGNVRGRRHRNSCAMLGDVELSERERECERVRESYVAMFLRVRALTQCFFLAYLL